MMDFKLKYVAPERMASGKMRYRFQRGGKKTTLRGEPGTREFHEHYAQLLDGTPPVPDGARAVKGSIAWLCGLFLRDLEQRVEAGLASPLTLKGHRHHLAHLVEEFGVKDARMPRGKLVQFLDKFAKTPGARDNRRKSIAAMYKWAIDRDYLPEGFTNPAASIPKINKKSRGFYTCTIEDVRTYMRHHGPGTMARRVMILELCTAARREDLRLLGPFNEFRRDERPWLRWTQSKAPNRVVEIPMMPMLQDEISDVRDGTYIRTTSGKPMTHGTIGNYVREWFNDAGARGSLHGVRKGLSAILPHLGATSYELDVLLGHEMGSSETKIYVAEAERTQLAESLGRKMARVKW